MNVVSYSIHHDEAEICDRNNVPVWRAIGIYGWPEAANKHHTWELKWTLKTRSTLPMVVFGDFNEILGVHEKDGGVVRGERQMEAFRRAIENCEYRDLGFKGNIFTWQRGTSVNTIVRERLDRYIADTPCDVCGRVFSDAWRDGVGDPLHTRIEGVAQRLTSWAETTFGALQKRIKKAEKRLKEMQGGSLGANRLKCCNHIVDELDSLRRLEESYWHVRARANELRDGDTNTKYFHHKATQRRKRNTICGLFYVHDTWKNTKEDMDEIISKYFGELFATSCPSSLNDTLVGIDELVTDDIREVMDMEPTGDEIWAAIFQMHPNKAPGPDGMHALFFQKFWDVIGGDVIRFVKGWWRGEVELDEMKRRGEGREGAMALKLDMSKACDRVEWCFLEGVMIKMGFRHSWIRRVMNCLSSVSFSFKYNGSISGSLVSSRGLRQGDPISPYLFLICAEAFSMLIKKAADDNLIHGAKSIRQKVNLSKTKVSFSKCVGAERRKEIIDTLGVREVTKHEKYLGLPTIIGRSKKAVFSCLKERIWKKLQGWKKKLLSRPRKEVLIKAVAQAIPTYMMSIFKILDELIDEIHSTLARFWWGSKGTERKMHWRRWELLCLPKSMGGMGFRDLKCFNQALLAKQGRRLCEVTNSLLQGVLKPRYYKHTDFIEARRGFDPSYTWRSIWGAKSLLLDGLKWRVGNGTSIKVWDDSWIPGEGNVVVPTPLVDSNTELRVSDLIDADTGYWGCGYGEHKLYGGGQNRDIGHPSSKDWGK
ncbi:uncharacterized protein [Spinacia oleracea]|uniref:Reverse transcriptase domain-containing protein n=1 Tax=Spinacia oleracea TaxID=3562 RepID=A0ABM3R3F1_SPIOL|nr:uncharacterized protein LOC110780188 [Spinacia oleracea]